MSINSPICEDLISLLESWTICDSIPSTKLTSDEIINFVDGIESQIIQDSNKDIKSSQIGELILKGLRKENEVAYIRYASVYRKFNGVKDFISTLESLKGNSKSQLASIS